MSQFDKISFSNQIFWFIIFFFFSYFLLLKILLPKIYITIKVREWKLNIISKEIKHFENIIYIWSNLNMNMYLNSMEELTLFISNLNKKGNDFISNIKKVIIFSFNKNKASQIFISNIKNIVARERFLNIKK